MKRITFEGNFCDIARCVGEPGNTSECESGFCDQRRTWERLKEYEDKIDRGELTEVVRCKKCVHYRKTKDWDGNSYYACHKRAAVLIMQMKPEDFCSYGEREDGE